MKLTDEDFQRLVVFFKDNYGINLSQKRMLIEGRLGFTISSRGFKSFKEYLDVVFSDKSGKEITFLVTKLTTNHTYFSRENDHFRHLNNVVLPHIEQTVKDHTIGIWSAGCSFGNEPYDLAMNIDTYFGSKKHLWDSKILATDISARALETAKQGIYTADAIKDVPPEWVEKHFTEFDDKYKISDKIRKEVIFKYFNLMDDFKWKRKFDLILCRNVMIYFDSETRNKLVEKFYDATKEGGYLYIGHAETLSKDTRYKMISPSIYRK